MELIRIQLFSRFWKERYASKILLRIFAKLGVNMELKIRSNLSNHLAVRILHRCQPVLVGSYGSAWRRRVGNASIVMHSMNNTIWIVRGNSVCLSIVVNIDGSHARIDIVFQVFCSGIGNGFTRMTNLIENRT